MQRAKWVIWTRRVLERLLARREAVTKEECARRLTSPAIAGADTASTTVTSIHHASSQAPSHRSNSPATTDSAADHPAR